MTKIAPITVIEVRMTERDGWFSVFSPDMPQLHLCGTDRRALEKDICPMIQWLYKLNYDMDIAVAPAASADLKPVRKTTAVRDWTRLLAFQPGAFQPA